MGRKVTIGLPGNTYKTKRKQKTINGQKIVVISRSYYGGFGGWDVYINGKFVRHNNGIYFENPANAEECMNWAIEKYL